MVIIQSQDFEISTHAVIDWLISLNTPYYKLTSQDQSIKFSSLAVTEDGKVDFLFSLGGKNIKYSEITAYWHRRGQVPLKPIESRKLLFLRKTLGLINFRYAVANLNEEKKHLSAFLGFILAQLPIKIGNQNNSTLNKLVVLYYATSLGIKISSTIITSSKDELLKYIKTSKSLITKSISDNLHTNTATSTFMFYTEQINDEILEDLPSEFYYSLFQDQIEKKYEVRAFYLHGKFYSMAIFSQNDKQTEVDFRKYNNDKPNRMVRFQLPIEIEEKLNRLMKLLKLDSGSIDIIVSTTNEFYFLEVNPVGQFGMVSIPCNYFIEREIANYLATGKFSPN